MKSLLLCILILGCVAGMAFADPVPPFTQCPAVGASPSCEFLINATSANTSGAVTAGSILQDTSVGPYVTEDVLVGILNSTSQTITSVGLNGTYAGGTDGIFDFDGDGACAFGGFSGCDSTGYGGPGVTFSNLFTNKVNLDNGTVNFSLAPGASAWFSLEGNPNLNQIHLGNTPEPGSLGLIGTGLIGLYGLLRRRKA